VREEEHQPPLYINGRLSTGGGSINILLNLFFFFFEENILLNLKAKVGI
jgi:hypothetical protein